MEIKFYENKFLLFVIIVFFDVIINEKLVRCFKTPFSKLKDVFCTYMLIVKKRMRLLFAVPKFLTPLGYYNYKASI